MILVIIRKRSTLIRSSNVSGTLSDAATKSFKTMPRVSRVSTNVWDGRRRGACQQLSVGLEIGLNAKYNFQVIEHGFVLRWQNCPGLFQPRNRYAVQSSENLDCSIEVLVIRETLPGVGVRAWLSG
jgi:hypothetical protein